MRTKEQATTAALTQGFAAAGGAVELLAALLPELGKLRYYRRFFEELEAAMDELST